MRDTLIGGFILLSVIGGYFAFRTKTETTATPNVTQTQPAPVVQASETQPTHIAPAPKQFSKKNISKRNKHSNLKRKAIHERPKHSSTKSLQNDEHYQGSSGEIVEAEKLPSIYQDQEGRQPELNSGEGTKSVYGVPVDAWVLSHQNTVSTEPADPKLAEGVRVYVGCVELKKEGARELSKRDCAKVATRNQSIN